MVESVAASIEEQWCSPIVTLHVPANLPSVVSLAMPMSARPVCHLAQDHNRKLSEIWVLSLQCLPHNRQL